MQRLFDEIADRLADVDRLIERDAELDARGNADHLRHGGAQCIDDLDRVGGRLLVHPQIDCPFSVGSNDVRLNVRGIGHRTEVAHAHRVALLIDFHDDVLNRLDGAELVVGEDVVIEVAGLDVPRGQNEVRSLDRFHHVQNRQAAGIEQGRVQINVDLADLSAFDGRGGDVGDLFDLRRDGVEGQVIERSLIEVVAGDSDEGDGNVRDVELDDKRLQDSRGQA